jgi:predicted DCC family thiol-disulfide oxidoreductase YuxK
MDPCPTTNDGRPIVVYDGQCAFCRSSIDRIRRRDRHQQFCYVPREAPGLEERFPAVAEGDFNAGMRLIEPDGTIHVGSDAIFHIASHLPWFRWFAWTYKLPVFGFVTRKCYAWVAANRMKLSKYCDTDGACRIDRSEVEGPSGDD